ncbi:hypothetical protein GN958_ATG15664 [Phytophthora infestans]|uniref:Uncharacterized protein n=1 Tax=Phytophthora infestans TaxID=4787 RepID=A0A8S9U3J7_PHYIN|nr:hypothetical protein GN958_ATG15664 [Phytophthora infestans]
MTRDARLLGTANEIAVRTPKNARTPTYQSGSVNIRESARTGDRGRLSGSVGAVAQTTAVREENQTKRVDAMLEQWRNGTAERDGARTAIYVSTVRPAMASARYEYAAPADPQQNEDCGLDGERQTGEGAYLSAPQAEANDGEVDSIGELLVSTVTKETMAEAEDTTRAARDNGSSTAEKHDSVVPSSKMQKKYSVLPSSS